MRPLSSLVLLSCLAGSTAHAQGTLVVSQNKCDADKQGQVRQLTDSLWLPIMQELVNEGKLLAAGSAYHAWGDEWNVVVWYTATDIPTFLSAFSDMVGRINQRHPTLFAQFQSWCSEHKDSMYSMGRATVPAAQPATPPRE